MLCYDLNGKNNGVILDDNWIIEPKLDGCRAMWHNQKLLMRNRNGNDNDLGIDRSDRFPQIVEALKGVEATLDGEIVFLNEKGLPQFNLLLKKENWNRAIFFVFDIIDLNGDDVTKWKLENRKMLLWNLFNPNLLNLPKNKDGSEYKIDSEFVKPLDICGYNLQIIENWKEQGMEGYVAKRKDGQYLKGLRSKYWCKKKFYKEMKVKILGLTEDKNHKSYGSMKTEYGDVGLLKMGNKIEYTQKTPKYVLVRYLEISDDGKFRFPTFIRFIYS